MLFEEIKKYPRALKLSIIEGMFASLMFGGGTIFVIPFAIFLGADSLQVGFLTAFPALLAAFAQLGSIKLLKYYKNRKKAIISLVFFQALSWFLIALIPFIFPQNQLIWLILIYTIGTIIGALGGPLWQSWMGCLTPKEILGDYFGVRNAITGTVVFLTMLGAGILLEIVEGSFTLYAFTAIFLVSFIGRALSSITFTKIEDPECVIETKTGGFFAFATQLGKDNFGHFVLFGTLMTFAISLVSPFLSVYLLNDLGLKNNYFMYTLIICAAAVTTLISMPYWGKIIDKYGTIRTLKATGILAALYPILLISFREPTAIIVCEALSGVIFSGFNLCLANFIYESFKREDIANYARHQAAFFGIATFLGTIFAGWLLTQELSFSFLTNAFYVVCAIAVIIRFTVYALLVNKIKEVRETSEIKSRKLVLGALTFEPVRETLFASAILLVTATEEIAVLGARKVGGIAKKGIYTAEELTLHAEKIAEKGIEEVEGITKNGFESAKKIIKKKK